jgi:ClpP class serine protease
MLLVERRGKKLTQPIGNYTTGEVWGGQDALGLGLVDSNGTIETLMSQHPDLKLVDFGPFERKSPLGGLLEQKTEDAAKEFQCIKSSLLASMQGYNPPTAIEFGRKVLFSTERPGFLELESHVKVENQFVVFLLLGCFSFHAI